MNNQQKQQVLEQVKEANNVLVAVSSNPSVDELAASIGLTLALNKMDKHATTVFSGVVPSTIEFLQPEKTIETTTDSLRDFIIALDKSKADKLRYKVEDNVVRIFITPYKTSITDKDLEFTQGDFNVDAVVALGVTRREDLDKAITAHGRILHDAPVISLIAGDSVSELGALNWQEPQASSLCEMVASLTTELAPEAIDGQMATALLTGIIAQTDRFKNQRTTPLALALSSQLMTAGANQQLIAEKLEEPSAPPELHHEVEANQQQETNAVGKDGELSINHDEDTDGDIDNIHIDDDGNLNLAEANANEAQQLPEVPAEDPTGNQASYLEEPPATNDTAQSDDSANGPNPAGSTEGQIDSSDLPTLKQPDSSATPMMAHEKVIQPTGHENDPPKSDKPFDLEEALAVDPVPQQTQPSAPSVPAAATSVVPAEPVIPPVDTSVQVASPALPSSDTVLPPPPETKPAEGSTLADLEKAVDSPHLNSNIPPVFPAPPTDDIVKVDDAREEVVSAASAQPPAFPSPTQAIGAQPVSLEPPQIDNGHDSSKKDKNEPPEVPPPMSPKFFDADGKNSNPYLNPTK